MSKLGKILLGATIAGGVVCIVLSVLIISKKKAAEDDLSQTQTKLATTSTERDKAKKEAVEVKSTLSAKEAQVTELTTKNATLEQSVQQAQSRVKQLEGDADSVKSKLTQAESELKKLTDSLGGQSPDEMKKSIKLAQDKITSLQNEKRIADDTLAAAKARVTELETYFDKNNKGTMPPGVSGRVTAVNKNWNFVVLNVGQKQNVVEGGELIVYRGQKMIGKVKVVSVESNSSVADILPEWAQSDLQTGDEVIN